MKLVKIAGLCLVSMLVMGMALAGSAFATNTPLWLLCLAGTGTVEYETNQCIKTKTGGKFVSVELKTTDAARILAFTLTLKDSGTALGTSEVQCWGGRSEGYVGSSGTAVVEAARVESPTTLCKGLKVCESAKVTEVAGIHLPWTETLIEGTENMARTKIEGSGGGAGWKVKCNVPLAGSETDECETKSGEPEEVVFLNTEVNSVLLVLGRFLGARTSSCTLGNSTSGTISGLFAILLASGQGLSINLA